MGFASQDLSGGWRSAPTEDSLRRDLPADELDDSGWSTTSLPGDVAAAGGAFFRLRFQRPAPSETSREWLVVPGGSPAIDVWLDGTYLGMVETSPSAVALEVGELTRARQEHLLAIELAAPDEHGPAAALPGPAHGLWGPLSLTSSGPARIDRLRVTCREASHESASLDLRVVIEADEQRVVEIRTTIRDPQGSELLELSRDVQLASGRNTISWGAALPDPELWWPWSLGAQPLHRVEVQVLTDDELSDSCAREIGLRQVSMRDRILFVNGEARFLKGLQLERLGADEAASGGERAAVALRAARAAELDLVRVHAHLAHPDLYEQADRSGMLIWQDMDTGRTSPLDRTARARFRTSAGDLVDSLGHHASVAMWGVSGSVASSWLGTRSTTDPSRPSVSTPALARSLLGSGVGGQDIARIARLWPRLARFATFADPLLGPDEPDDASRAAEALRRLKYRPCAGYLLSSVPPTGSAGAGAVCVSIAGLPERPMADQPIHLDVYAVNDLPIAFSDTVMTVHLSLSADSSPGGVEPPFVRGGRRERAAASELVAQRAWTGSVPADACTFVGSIDARIPDLSLAPSTSLVVRASLRLDDGSELAGATSTSRLA